MRSNGKQYTEEYKKTIMKLSCRAKRVWYNKINNHIIGYIKTEKGENLTRVTA